ncbi:MAG: AraC family transcriptional regulator ligand-binding domain-containing protein [Nevskia sp.]|nr:AraC family transcriptional regulator ligand-binding domain-containing protein [Nevskia sp.]
MVAAGLINRFAHALIGNAASKGYHVEVISHALQLTPEVVRDRNARFDAETFCRISRNVKLLMDDEFCGFTTAPCRVGSFQHMCENALRGETLGQALQRAFAFYAPLTGDIRFELQVHEDAAGLRMNLAHPELDRYNFLYEWWFIVWSHFAAWLIGEEVPVLAADFPHPRAGSLEEYAATLTGNCRFSRPVGSLLLPVQYLERRTIRRPEDLPAFLEPSGNDIANVFGVHRSFRSLLRALMREHLGRTRSVLSIEEAAAHYNISSQTLRRRLQSECTSYRLLKEQVRRELVLEWLECSDIGIGEASLLAGFAETNGLSRALKSWVGVSPSEYRQVRPGPAAEGA